MPFRTILADLALHIGPVLTMDETGMMLRRGALPAIFWGGLLCGVFDIAYALAEWAVRGVAPVRILQGIASGILGPASFRGGMATAVFGLALHFLIAFTAATVYFFASQFLSFMKRQAVLAGLLYGIAVYCFMHYVVIPLSALRHRPFDFWFDSFEILEHMLLVGLPIALSTRKFSRAIAPEQLGGKLDEIGKASTTVHA